MNDDNEYLEHGYVDDEVEYYAVRPNKTQIKKDIAALFELGEAMSKLSSAQLGSFELPEKIRTAITQVAVMPYNGARKRLLKYIAGQLHKIEVEPIFEHMARLKNKSAHGVREHHMAERWRDRLLNEGNNALTDFLLEQPDADSQILRQMVRNAIKEAETLKAPKSARMLYRYLKTLLTEDTRSDDFEVESDSEDE